MNLLIASAMAIAQDESVHALLTERRLSASQGRGPGAGGTNGVVSPEAAAEAARAEVVEMATATAGTAHDAMRAYILRNRGTRTAEETAADLIAMTIGFRKLRDLCDEFESMAGRVARVEGGVSVRALANSTGISERNAAKRYRLIPGEGLTSPIV